MKLQNGATPLKWMLQAGDVDSPYEFGTVLARTTNKNWGSAELVVWNCWREEPDADFLCCTGDYYCHDHEGALAEFNKRNEDYPLRHRDTYTTATQCHMCGEELEKG